MSGRVCYWHDVCLLVLGWLSAPQASDVALDELVLIQKDTHTELNANAPLDTGMQDSGLPEGDDKVDERTAPSTMLSSQRRKSAITLVKAEFDKLMSEQDLANQLDGTPGSLQAMDPAAVMEMLPSLMDALRDDNFIRSFIEFEDGIEKASSNVIQYAHNHLSHFLHSSNSSNMVLARGSNTVALRLRVAEFLDYWMHKVLVSYPQELTKHASVFSEQVGGDHQLSKGFADLFIPLFQNMSDRIGTRMIPGAPDNCSNPMSFVDVLGNSTEAYFCSMVGAILQNASKTTREATQALKVLNMTRRSAVPMLGKFLQETLPLDASEEDKQVPQRMMLVVDYEVSAVSAGINVLRETMGEYAAGLAPIMQDMRCEPSAASRLSALSGRAVFLLLALAARPWP